MPQYIVSGSNLTAIASAIRTKNEVDIRLKFPDDFINNVGNNEYIKKLICPQQNFTISGFSLGTLLVDSDRLVTNKNYIITYDNVEYFCTCKLIDSVRCLGDCETGTGSAPSQYIFPFFIRDSDNGTGPQVYSRDSNQHTIKIEYFEILKPEMLISKSITANGTYNPINDNAKGYSQVTVNVAVKTKTGTFTGDGTRQADISCDFEPDLVYWNSDPGSEASSGTVVGVIVRGVIAVNRYRNNSTSNSHSIQTGITGMNTAGSSYNFKVTHANETVSIYCFSSAARSLFTNGRTYSYTFMKWT